MGWLWWRRPERKFSGDEALEITSRDAELQKVAHAQARRVLEAIELHRRSNHFAEMIEHAIRGDE